MTVDEILKFLVENEGVGFTGAQISEACGVNTKHVTIYMNRLMKYYKDEITVEPSKELVNGRFIKIWTYRKC